MIKLNEVHQERKNAVIDIEDEIKRIEQLLVKKKKDWQTIQHNFNEIDYYKTVAKSMNTKKRFSWVEVGHEEWGNIKQDKWTYDGIEKQFTLKIKHRTDLKMWKYEVHVSVEYLKFSTPYYSEYGYQKQNGSSYYADDKEYGETVMTKYKTHAEALKKIKEWQKTLVKKFDAELKKAKHLYNQACQKYDDTIRIRVQYKERKALREMLKFYTDVMILDEGDSYLEITGTNSKEVVSELNEKYKLKIEVLAG
jgi:hypothetical protein